MPEASITSSAYTAGPWYLSTRMALAFRYGEQEEYYISTTKGDVAVIPNGSWFSVSGDQTQANARLIVVAPELLEACKQAVWSLNQIPNTKLDGANGHKNTYSVCSMLDALISKAERGK